MLPLNREKTRAEIAKLQEETRKLEYERLRSAQVATIQFVERLPNARNPDSNEPTPEQVIESAERRLESHGIKLRNIEVRLKSNQPNDRDASQETSTK